jgi:predicted transcriptional regulator
MELMQAWIYMYRDTFSPSERSDEIDHVMIYDEGYMMYDQNKERQTKSIPAVNQMTAQLRDFMEGLIVATQVPSQLTDFITANTNTKLILPSADWKQFKATGESFNFDRFQENATWNIELSEGVVTFSSRGPFKVVLDHFDIEKTVSDDDLVQKYSSTYRELLDAPSKEREKRLERQGEDKDSIGQRGRAVDKLSSEAVEILKDIAENPFRKTTTRYELLENVSTGKAHEYKAELVDHGLIKPVHVSAGSKVFKLFELTDRGLNTAREFKADIHTTGKGGLKHRFYQHKIKELLEDKVEVEIEGQDADALASYEDREVAYEVAMSSSSREVEHVEKHLDNDINEVVVCCADRKVLENLRDEVPDSNNVELKEIADIV